MKTLWINAVLYLPDEKVSNGTMLVGEDGRIEALGAAEYVPDEKFEIMDIQGQSLLPGFIDVHIHGGNGYNVMDAKYASLDEISKFHAAHGTTSFLATTNTSTHDKIVNALRSAAAGMKQGVTGAQMLGIHLEGPFISLKRKGAQNKDEVRNPTMEEMELFIQAAEGRIRLVTLAPELIGGMEGVKYFSSQNVTVSAGHSDASYQQMEEAVACGVTHTTHHFNGMSPFHHREPGLAGAGLMMPELTTELVADGIHVHPAAVKFLFDVKTPSKVCAITDAVTCCGLPNGEYGHIRMKDGQIYLKDSDTLAGSSLTMIQALKNILEFTGYPLEYVLPSFTLVPARQIGADHCKGSLEAGKDADFLVVDENLQLLSTFVKGREVYKSGL